jgi:hypothetical protein
MTELHMHLGVWQRAYRKARNFLHHDILSLESTFVEKQPPISVTNQQQQVAMAVLESVMAVLLLAAAEVKEAAEEEEEEAAAAAAAERSDPARSLHMATEPKGQFLTLLLIQSNI